MNIFWRRGLAAATLAYAVVVLTRPLNNFLQFDPATVNPPGGAGQFVDGVRLAYYVLVPALYALASALVFAGKRSVRRLFLIALVLELSVCGAYLYIASEIDMLGLGKASRWAILGAYFLIPATLLAFIVAKTPGKSAPARH